LIDLIFIVTSSAIASLCLRQW